MTQQLCYTPTHDWIRVEGSQVTVGISKAFQQELEEIVYIALPPIGKQLRRGEEAVILESTKAAMDLLAPFNGVVIAIHETLRDNPLLLKTSTEEEGWLFQMEVEDLTPMQEYLHPAAYRQYLGEDQRTDHRSK